MRAGVAGLRFVLDGERAAPAGSLGGKAAALAALRGSSVPIPAWIALTPEAFHASLLHARRTSMGSLGQDGCPGALLKTLALSPEVEAELEQALGELCPDGQAVAVRSSAPDEDGARHAFAGQLDSFLFVPPRAVPEKVVAVWRSAFGERSLAYRREHGLLLLPAPPAVLIQRMVDADAAGVAVSADPVTARRGIAVVTAVYGLGTGLVSGECDADTYRVDRDGRILTRVIARKRTAHRRGPGGGDGVEAFGLRPKTAGAPALGDEQVRAVAELARRAERHFGRPQDIEWAIESDALYLLQSRPITGLAALADPDGEARLWDNSNIAESYGGITTPLTFSFARRAYAEVYRQFCRMMGVPAATIARRPDLFRGMIGLIRGRVYYNLLKWYHLLALLPGFAVNRRFMEQMMGVKEGLPEAVTREVCETAGLHRLFVRARLVSSVVRLVANHLRISRRVGAFRERLERVIGDPRPDLEWRRADELVDYYRELERMLLARWDAPLINDFLAMIFHGLLRRLTVGWCADAEGTLPNALLCGEGGLVSAEPASRVEEMARLAADWPDLVSALCQDSREALLTRMSRYPDLVAAYEGYLARFGDRCVGELKLESPTLRDDPLMLLRAVGRLARERAAAGGRPPEEAGGGGDIRREAEGRVRRALAGHPLRRAVFGWVLRNARARVRDRENLRFARTRVFGRARRIFVELGRRLHAADALEDPRDVFYLDVDEVLGFVEGTTTCPDLKGLAAVRKAEFERYGRLERPADRFETRGAVHQGNTFRGTTPAGDQATGERRRGLGCCPGRVRGPVRVVTDPRHAEVRAGEILVAERTDPGWILLFSGAAGLLVEHGSLLSHSAIVARELRLPAIVAVEGVSRWLKDGDRVELDGESGVVTRLDGQSSEARHAV